MVMWWILWILVRFTHQMAVCLLSAEITHWPSAFIPLVFLVCRFVLCNVNCLGRKSKIQQKCRLYVMFFTKTEKSSFGLVSLKTWLVVFFFCRNQSWNHWLHWIIDSFVAFVIIKSEFVASVDFLHSIKLNHSRTYFYFTLTIFFLGGGGFAPVLNNDGLES